jgi:hypothetical protein
MAPKVVYIMGFGHSGSTLLDIVLSNHPHVESVGELKKVHRYGWTNNNDRRCACGLPVYQCPYWSEVHQRWSEKVGKDDIEGYIRLQNRFEYYRPLPRLRWVWEENKKRSAEFIEYVTMTTALYEAIQETSGKTIIVDSSKQALRAYGLLLGQSVDLYLIHLVRTRRRLVFDEAKSETQGASGWQS